MRKPIIAAVVGGAYGGGVEMILNCDIVIASEDAKFTLPEVKRGVVAIQGGVYIHFVLPVWLTSFYLYSARHSKISTHCRPSGNITYIPCLPDISLFHFFADRLFGSVILMHGA